MPLSPQVLRMQCHPSVLFFSAPLLVKLHHSICSHRHQVLKYKDEDCEGFLPWLEKKAGFEISSVLSIGKFIDGRSLFASKRIQTGDYMLKVPFDVQLSPDNILPEIKALLDDEVGIITRLAIVILTEQKKGQDSEWAPYISHLPNPGEIHTTLFWNASELEMVKQSSVYQEAVHQQAQVRNDYFAVKPVKAEHQKPSGLLQSLELPTWKWDRISMDFVVSLLRTVRKNGAIWFIVDELTKSAHFFPIRFGTPLDKLAELYIDIVLQLHGVPVEIVSDRDPRFV